MMDFMNGGFNLMGDIFGDDFEMPDPAPKKEKKAAKKEEKTDSKKTVSKKTAKKLAKVTLPCKVYGGSFRLEIPGNGEEVDTARLSELIAEAGYIEVKNSSMSVYVPEDLKSTAYVVTDAASFATGNDIAADFSNNQEIVFACGDERLTMKPEDFEGKDEDEICVKDLGDRISECFPHYKGEFCYDIASATIVPVRRKADLIDDKTTIPLPAVFCVSGEEHLLNEESLSGKEPTAKNIVDLLTASFSHKNIHCYLYKMDEGKYGVYMQSVMGDKASGTGKKSASAKKVEKKYPATAVVYLSFNDYREQLSPEKFDGKEKVTLAQIIDYLKPRFAILGNEEKRKSIKVFSYDEEINQINLVVSEGTRGAASASFNLSAEDDYVESGAEMDSILHRSPVTAFNKLIGCRGKYAPYYMDYVYATRTKAFIYQKAPFGSNNLKAFFLKTPRIPASIREEMYQFFRSEMPNEAICKIAYNYKTGLFYLLKPERMTADAVSVKSTFIMPASSNVEIVATFHSHNRMPAYFSSVDDAAELDQIGVFGVVGRLDTDKPQVVIRAVYEGGIKNVPPYTFFDVDMMSKKNKKEVQDA